MTRITYRQGEILYVDFEPHRGHEPAKYRPALVVSDSAFNARSSMTVLCPITSRDNGYPMHVYLDGADVRGFACAEQLRALDLEVRKCRRVGMASAAEMSDVLNLVGAVFGI